MNGSQLDVRLPNLGEGADSGIVVNLLVKEGDTIQADQPVLEIENEKAVAAIPSSAAGVVAQIHVKPGDKVSVGQRLLSLAGSRVAKGAETARQEARAPEPAGTGQPASKAGAAAVAGETTTVEEEQSADGIEAVPGQPPAASPSIRRLAKQLGIELAKVRGSARGNRIVMNDLRLYVQRLEKLAARALTPSEEARKPARLPIDFAQWGPISIKPLSALRQVVSRRMSESWTRVPRVTQFDEADVTRLLALRQEHVAAYQQQGARLTLTGFILKAVANVLQRHPIFNSSLDEREENLVLKAYCHIGMAVNTDAGLIVPVIRDVDKKSLLELSRDLEELARKARDRKVTTDELKGGTFTISNQGGIGGAHFTPVINLPEVAILGLGRGAVKPVWRNDRVEPRTHLPLALAYDHRVIDGADAARFIVDLVTVLEQFDVSWL